MDGQSTLPLLSLIAVAASGLSFWVGPKRSGILAAIAVAGVMFTHALDRGLIGNESPSPTAPPPAPARHPSNLDAQLDTVLKVASCPYAKQFVENNPSTPQARAASAWLNEHCRVPEPPNLPSHIGDTGVAALQTELARVRCYIGPIDGLWRDELQTGINAFNAYAKEAISIQSLEASLATTRGTVGQICP